MRPTSQVWGLLVALNGLGLWASFIFLRLLLFPAWLSAPSVQLSAAVC